MCTALLFLESQFPGHGSLVFSYFFFCLGNFLLWERKTVLKIPGWMLSVTVKITSYDSIFFQLRSRALWHDLALVCFLKSFDVCELISLQKEPHFQTSIFSCTRLAKRLSDFNWNVETRNDISMTGSWKIYRWDCSTREPSSPSPDGLSGGHFVPV